MRHSVHAPPPQLRPWTAVASEIEMQLLHISDASVWIDLALSYVTQCNRRHSRLYKQPYRVNGFLASVSVLDHKG